MAHPVADAGETLREFMLKLGGFEPFLQDASPGQARALFALPGGARVPVAANALGRALLAHGLDAAAHERLSALATRLAPTSGVRLERLVAVAGSEPVSLACRRLRQWPEDLNPARDVDAAPDVPAHDPRRRETASDDTEPTTPLLLGVVTLSSAEAARLLAVVASEDLPGPVVGDRSSAEPPARVPPAPGLPAPGLPAPDPTPLVAPDIASSPDGMAIPTRIIATPVHVHEAPSPDTPARDQDLAAPQRPAGASPGPARFLWETDADGAIVSLSAEAGAIFGAAHATMIGMSWRDLSPAPLDGEPHQWRARDVLLPVADGTHACLVALSGMPVRDRAGELVGARGFGLVRGDLRPATAAVARAQLAPANIPAPARPVDPGRTDTTSDDRGGEPGHGPDAGMATTSPPGPDTVSCPAVVGVRPVPDAQESADPAGAPGDPAGAPADPAGAPGDRAPEPGRPSLSNSDRSALREIARALGARVEGEAALVAAAQQATPRVSAPAGTVPTQALPVQEPPVQDVAACGAGVPPPDMSSVEAEAPVPDRALPSQPPLDDRGREVPSAPPSTPPAASSSAKLKDSPAEPPHAAAAVVAHPALRLVEARARGASTAALMPVPITTPDATHGASEDHPETARIAASQAPAFPGAASQSSLVAALAEAQRLAGQHGALLDRLPIGALVMREGRPVYANRTLLDLLGDRDLPALAARAPDRLFAHRTPPRADQGAVSLLRADGEPEPVEARLSSLTWHGEPATLMAFRRAVESVDAAELAALKLDLARRARELGELAAVLDIATDGVVTVDAQGRILSLNRTAEALFGYDQREVTGEHITALLAPESHITALDYLDGLKGSGVAALMNDGREVQGRVRQGGRIPLFVTMGRIADGDEPRFCAVLRDMTAWKQAETELLDAKRAAEAASAQKSDVLAKISHEIRTPLNAIIGFAEIMAEERFGPVGNDRYRGYLKDIHDSGGYVISLVNDLLDLAKIEAGKVDLSFAAVSLNEIATASVSLLQSEAQRQRVVLRCGLNGRLPPVVADERSIRQIVLNILSNAIKFTDPGGQVIVSTAMGDRGEAILRVRDTGIGMSDKELAAAMEPFRQVANTRRGQGTGLGLPITRALVEANKGLLTLSSVKGEGTLVEVSFPPQRVLAS